MTPIRALHHQAESRPDQIAFVAGDDAWSYRRLVNEAERLARAFVARGVRPGDRVALHMANYPELVVAYYACLRAGAIAAPLNIRFKTAELRRLLERLRPTLYLGEAQLYPLVATTEPAILRPGARFVLGDRVEDPSAQPWSRLFEGADDGAILRDPDIDAPALLLTTSGTTGLPKFVTHTQATLAAITDSGAEIGFGEGEISINALPMMHVAGLATLFWSVRFGVPMVLLERFDADAVLDAIEARRCSWMFCLPFMCAELAKRQRARRRRLTSLRTCLVGGDACPVALQDEFHRVLGAPLRNFWGSSETAGSLIHGLLLGPVCRVAPGAEVRLVDEEGAPVKRGEVGELQLRGPNVMVGYWKGPGRVDDPTTDGWFATGDLMREDEEGDLWFVGRKKDLLIRGGSNISPVEVERVLLAHPAVANAIVVGVPDAELGQRVAALVELAAEARDAKVGDILATAKAQLADYKLPERLEIVAAIPRNAMGKLCRRTALAMLTETAAAAE